MREKSPDAYRTISEAGEEAGLPPHVLRFWESKFSALKPIKRAGGRRMYRPQDILLLKGLRRLLYDDGYTIKGAQKYLREHGVANVAALADDAPASADADPAQADTSSAPAVQAESQASEATHPDMESAAEPVAVVMGSGGALTAEHQALAQRAMGRLQTAKDRIQAVLNKAGTARQTL